ncbi:MAG: hypothetical protein H7Y37_18855 [Anaerolineae bacterium]|nr:hypothetical protein [Gloeobacterales cyanobacterium ES-bin-313]
MTTNMISAGISGLLLVSLCTFTTPVQAFGVENGSFETGDFSNWSTLSTGNQAVVDNTAICGSTTPCSGSPTDGNFAALLTTPSTGNVSSLETFLGLTPGSLIASNVTGGSAISQTFTLDTAGTLNFSWNFLTNETLRTPASNDDFASYFLSPGGYVQCNVENEPCVVFPGNFGFSVEADPLASVLGSTLIASGTQSFDSDTRFNSVSLSLGAGTYTLQFLVANRNDTTVQSGLLVDNINFQPIPEPVTTSWLGAALALGVSAQFRRRKTVLSKKRGATS